MAKGESGMKKSDLKTGMWIENRLGKKALVLLNTKNGDIVSGPEVWGQLDNYKDDLINYCGKNFDIVKVYQPKNNFSFYNFESYELVWERKEEPITVTLEEIAKWKGVDVDNIRIMPSSVRQTFEGKII
jgi:hypothetical protein